jgi:hypothetical protein
MTYSIATLIMTILDILCCYAECNVFIVMLSVVILNVMAPTK